MSITPVENYINYTSLKEAKLSTKPFPYLVIPNLIKHKFLPELISNFPNIINRGSIPVKAISDNSLFKKFTDELEGLNFRRAVENIFSIDLIDKPTMLTLRGQTTERDGIIHTDSKSKLITILIYMNETWDNDGGQLRLLNSKKSLDDHIVEVAPLAGTCIMFEVTPNCWHGHKPFVGKRQSLQLNYLSSDAALTKHLNHHKITAWLKKLFPRIFHTTSRTY
ncbi:2OG-Fe(II) oxygenase [Gammaproteobacteria bacterium]|nr:2OG-Fe(II) oxygenase [Gammaproteobacteria bacterium]